MACRITVVHTYTSNSRPWLQHVIKKVGAFIVPLICSHTKLTTRCCSHCIINSYVQARIRNQQHTVFFRQHLAYPGVHASLPYVHVQASNVSVVRHSLSFVTLYSGGGWLCSWMVSMLDSGAVGPGFKSQPRRCRVTVLGKLFTPIVPLFTKQQNW